MTNTNFDMTDWMRKNKTGAFHSRSLTEGTSVLTENEDEDETAVSSEMKELLPALKKVLDNIPMRDVINYLNDKDVDYYGWTDLQMIIYYIEHN